MNTKPFKYRFEKIQIQSYNASMQLDRLGTIPYMLMKTRAFSHYPDQVVVGVRESLLKSGSPMEDKGAPDIILSPT